MRNFIDLHIHSTASDGSDAPSVIAALAKKAELSAFALTDHDTVSGVSECRTAALCHGVRFISGIEISAHDAVAGEVHVLGYNVDHTDAAFLAALEDIKSSREVRNLAIIDKLRALGANITPGDVLMCRCEGTVGRPHIAMALVASGFVADMNEAFEIYLGQGGAAYVPRENLPPETAISIIKKAGGAAYLAHPHLLSVKGADLEKFAARLASAGLRGIEVYYTGYTGERIIEYSMLAAKYRLSLSGGSDYHGETVHGGIEIGASNAPDWLLENLL